ncbi:glycoside hydrolase family 18 protein [Xylona heveae TC161]|uniref:chitinase n=1 Tax=Xylona heveae (strain CBS 132557 / TC161) TaxID=1328760 RepID=A0A165AIA6_XYLHT|nr:glycoside hydrolase family 18 protein [Xylona heveae TC161]KZF20522.1 glycoside hydrolase family 18 protein [Xylona heveae TC161]
MHFNFLLFLTLLGFSFRAIVAQHDASCSALEPCHSGCCSSYGTCGFGPAYCGDGCQGSCNATAECGKWAADPGTKCPLNVCCSEFGFCGTTSDFCNKECQSNCDPVEVKTCSENTNALDYKRRIAYYELWSATRNCDAFAPENIAAGALTHINIAFATLDEDFKIIDTLGDLVARVSRLKKRYAGLRASIAIGGWSFNDPPTQHIFSDMVSTYTNRQTFIDSLVSYLHKYGLDGVDIDWEYPAAIDRGGAPEDTNNYVLLMSEIKERFAQEDPGWEATITLPSSYWYLRGFDLPGLQRYISWFNVMTYDIHGMWDQDNEWTGSYLRGHTNLTEIEQGLDLLWRNDVDPSNVVMGFGFYGRSFTMSDPNCYQPGCNFSAAGIAGDCTNTAGILSYAEVASRNDSLNTNTYYDAAATLKYMTYDGTQWISYDDEQSFTDKKRFLSSHCISGLMIWAIDQDTSDYQALGGLLGEDAMQDSLITGGELSDSEKSGISSEFAAYTGQNCFVTPVCTDGTKGQKGPDQICPSGYTSVSTAHAPSQAPNHTIKGDCSEGWYRYICCPTQAMPQNCQWNGNPERSEFGCSGTCGSDQFLLNTDSYTDPLGHGQCYMGNRNLCCDSAEVLNECFWTDCQDDTDGATCPKNSVLQTWRYDEDGGAQCDPGQARSFCCPSSDTYSNCAWSNDMVNGPDGYPIYDPNKICNPSQCPSTQVAITWALDPPSTGKFSGGHMLDCSGYPPGPGQSAEFPYCCDPPNEYNNKWPVDPKYLWEDYYDETGDDVQWSYADNQGNNVNDHKLSDDYGADPYGFVMLDGPKGSLDNDFPSSFTVSRREEHIPMAKRSLVTSNQTTIDSTFDHSEETIHVYCNYPMDSPRCQKVFYKGAVDTIIRLPDHVGEGPFARIVSMEVDPDHALPVHHLRARQIDRNRNEVYKVKFDYNFHLIKRDSQVNMRIDYTNLESYWDEMTASKDSRKRSVNEEHLSYRDWRYKVDTAKETHFKLRKRGSETEMAESSKPSIVKRWFGAFKDWLNRLNTIENKDMGFLSMAIRKTIKLYHAQRGCQSSTAMASLDIDLDAYVNMEATYAYYFSGTIVPPAVTGTYAYFGLEPTAYLGLSIKGYAQMQYTSDRKRLVDTLSYPGLSVKGIAAVGPTLDIYGQIKGVLTVAGQMNIGTRYNFGLSEVYWPDEPDDDSAIKDLVQHPDATTEEVVPVFDAAVRASADLDIMVTPEANLGIRIGGGGGIFGTTLVDAQLVGFMNNTLRFHAEATGAVQGSGSSGSASASYKYGAYFLYNLGFGGYANIPFYSWNAQSRFLFDSPRTITLYEDGDVASASTRKRDLPRIPQLPRRGLLNSITNEEISSHPDAWSDQISEAETQGRNYSMLRPRDDISTTDDNGQGEVSAFSLATLFTCPKGDNCTASNSGSSAPGKRSDELTRRAVSSGCGWTLPDFRYNCHTWFANTVITGPSGTTAVDGICQNVGNFYRARSLSTDGMVLTWDPNTARVEDRRAATCGQQACVPENINYQNEVGLGNIRGGYVSCDEFPFAGSEEGGDYFGHVHETPTGAQMLCAPVWQQNLQGGCNQMLSTLSTNVAYLDDPNTQTSNWQSWDKTNTAWNTVQQSGFGRTANYPNQIPQAAGIDNNRYALSNFRLGYTFKRNFTMGLATPSGPQDTSSWGTQPISNARAYSQTANWPNQDATTVACAINIFGQSDIYRFDGGYNGYCFNGQTESRQNGAFSSPGYNRCKVDFVGGPGPAKRSLGDYNGWEIENIEMSDDPDTFIPVDDINFHPKGMNHAKHVEHHLHKASHGHGLVV